VGHSRSDGSPHKANPDDGLHGPINTPYTAAYGIGEGRATDRGRHSYQVLVVYAKPSKGILLFHVICRIYTDRDNSTWKNGTLLPMSQQKSLPSCCYLLKKPSRIHTKNGPPHSTLPIKPQLRKWPNRP
jgi:hypothetical protein